MVSASIVQGRHARAWRRLSPRLAALALALAAVPFVAQAHVGGDAGGHHGFVAGLLHPFTGMDHLFAMLAVGVWSGLVARRVWVAPIAFAAMLLVGALIGSAGVALPAVETMIALSLVVLGALLAGRVPLGAGLAAAAVGGFALFHGAAHGVELAGDGFAAALAGMVLGTAVLHVVGVAAGRSLATRPAQGAGWLPRAGGVAIALLGAMMLAPLA